MPERKKAKPFRPERRKLCPKCGGKGTVTAIDEYGRQIIEDCPRCGGDGYL